MSAVLSTSAEVMARFDISMGQLVRAVKNGVLRVAARGPRRSLLFREADLEGMRRHMLVDEAGEHNVLSLRTARQAAARALGQRFDGKDRGPLVHNGLTIDVRYASARQNALGQRLIFQTRKGNATSGYQPMESDLLVCVGQRGRRRHFFVYPTAEVQHMVGVGFLAVPGNKHWDRRQTATSLRQAVERAAQRLQRG